MNASAALAEAGLPGISPDVYGPADFRAVADIVHADAGIVLPPGKAMLVYSRIAPLVRGTGSITFSAYVEKIRNDPAERRRAVGALTTNHTYFYREVHHFLHFAEQVRPKLIARLEGGLAVRLWSAGCSSGEETWSLVMTLLGEDKAEGKRIAGRNLRVLASDIAAHALTRASTGSYAAAELKEVPFALRQHWTREHGDMLGIGPEARQIVRFRTLNLLGAWPMARSFDAIFCRNVMIYFDQPTKERLLTRFAESLTPGGHLYIGHSERVTGPAEALLSAVGPTIYRRRSA